MTATTREPDDGDVDAADVVVVDAIGKACPMPVLDLAAAVKDANVGTTVHLLADDSTAKVDVPIWCRLQRHRLDDVVKADDHVRFEVTKTRG